MIVMQYEMRFSKVARHAIWLVPTDRERIRRFVDDLTYHLCILMAKEKVSSSTFEEVVDIAYEIKSVRRQERDERETKRHRRFGCYGGAPSRGQFHHSRGCPFRHAQLACQGYHGASLGHGSHNSHQGQSSLSALLAQSLSRAPSFSGLFYASIQHLFKHKDLILRQRRWLEFLKDYDITILYHPGKVNVVADASSQKPVSMGSLAYIPVRERPLAVDVQVLANRFMRLDISETSQKYIGDPSHVLDFSTVQLDGELTYDVEPAAILERQVQNLRSKDIASVKVQ
ncbi:uncharacterized protein [Nicotiana sylvestris]|uniref:uncharacterized protein n=1 Tax=Nicotiana sylvestris TaxID=4096 RepID=UPI00388C7E5A